MMHLGNIRVFVSSHDRVQREVNIPIVNSNLRLWQVHILKVI